MSSSAPSRLHPVAHIALSLDDAPAAAAQPAAPVSTAAKSPGRPKPNHRRIGPTRLETVEDPLGPLGASVDSLGDSQVDEPPAPPQKELAAGRGSRPTTATSQSSIRGMMESVNLDESLESPTMAGARVPPPVQPPSNNGPPRQTQPSVSVEQAAKPTFHITVGDPHKVGDLTSSHTEYQVRTVVCFYISLVALVVAGLTLPRLPRRLTGILNLPSPAATAISSGCTTSSIITILASSSRLLRKSKP